MLYRLVYPLFATALIMVGHQYGILWEHALNINGFTLDHAYRLFTAHFMHLDIPHLYSNLFSLWLMTVIFWDNKTITLPRLLVISLLAMVAVDVAYYFIITATTDIIISYLGFSGIVYAYTAYLSISSIPTRPVVGLGVLLLTSCSVLLDFLTTPAQLSWQAHGSGLLVGTICALLWICLDARRAKLTG